MVNDTNKNWPQLENDKLVTAKSWELEAPGDSVDDRIVYLTSITQNRHEARDLVNGTTFGEHGSGDLETDLGYIQCQPPRKA
jgi:hypothetical protein